MGMSTRETTVTTSPSVATRSQVSKLGRDKESPHFIFPMLIRVVIFLLYLLLVHCTLCSPYIFLIAFDLIAMSPISLLLPLPPRHPSDATPRPPLPQRPEGISPSILPSVPAL